MLYVLLAIVGVVVLILIYVLSLYNGLVRLNNRVKEAFSTMDVYLKKRWDLIPNLVETVKGYAKHEKGTLEDVIKLRNGAYDSMTDDDKIKTNAALSRGVMQIMALAESYPDLKANSNFMDLSRQLSEIEGEIANSRKYYNAVVKMFNDKVEVFPNNIFAGMFGRKTVAMFETNAAERENVQVKF